MTERLTPNEGDWLTPKRPDATPLRATLILPGQPWPEAFRPKENR